MTFEEWWHKPGAPLPDVLALDYERAIFLAGRRSGFSLGTEAAAKVCREKIQSRCPTCKPDGHRTMECFHMDHAGSNSIAAECVDAVSALRYEDVKGET